jgi:hypothetical protein
MIFGALVVIYSADAAADRAFFSDVGLNQPKHPLALAAAPG